MVSCSGVFLALVEGLHMITIEKLPGVPGRYQRCWTGMDLQRKISVEPEISSLAAESGDRGRVSEFDP